MKRWALPLRKKVLQSSTVVQKYKWVYVLCYQYNLEETLKMSITTKAQESFTNLRKRLDQLGYQQPLGIESLPLVERLFADLLHTTESLRSVKVCVQPYFCPVVLKAKMILNINVHLKFLNCYQTSFLMWFAHIYTYLFKIYAKICHVKL